MFLGGISFKTKKSVEDYIRKKISENYYGKEFECDVISDLIFKHHYFCSLHKIRPIKFKAIDHGGDSSSINYTFYGFFDGIGWKGVTWKKSLYPQTWNSAKTPLLRLSVADDMESFRLNNYKCESCGKTSPPLNCHHKEPSFAEMAKAVDSLFTNADLEKWINRNWLDDGDFHLEENNQAVSTFVKLHKKSTMTVLCANCHKQHHRTEK